MRNINRFVFFLLIFAGCGYHYLNPTNKVCNIYLPIFENKTLRPGLDVFLTENVRQNLIREGSFKLVNSQPDADWLVLGEVREYKQTPIFFSPENPDEVAGAKISLKLNMRILEQKSGAKLYEGEISTFAHGLAKTGAPWQESKIWQDLANSVSFKILEKMVQLR